MSFNLLTNPAFPVVTRGGARRWLAFADLAVIDGDDAPIDFDWPSAVFNATASEFAIGVVTAAFQPAKASDWHKLWNAPPGPNAVRDAIEAFRHAFDLDGDGPRFCQEFGGLDGEANPVEALLIDTPGANGQKKNADLLTHRARYPALGLPAAAMALYAMQQFAPAGGAGNRTSMRGGGPLTTLVIPGAPDDARPPLWRTILANVVPHAENEWDEDDLPKIFPWLAPTITSKNERQVHERDEDVHRLQAFFGMPRRVALRLGPAGVCAMTGDEGPLVAEWVQKPWGVNYGLWTHPLTPYRRQKEGSEPYSVKPKSNRFGYRDWVAVTVAEEKGALATPAPAVALARSERSEQLRGAGRAAARLQASGWAMNNMEAMVYLFAEQPLHLARSEKDQDLVDKTARDFAKAADIVAGALVGALRAALFSEGAKPATDKSLFEAARTAFYETTEDAFHATLDAVIEAPSPDDSRARGWLKEMSAGAAHVFDIHAPVPVDEPERAGRIADALRNLRAMLAGYGKVGAALYDALGLAAPQPKPKPQGGKAVKKGGPRGR